MKNERVKDICFWIIAMILCPLGVAFSTKGGFGVSMIEAPVYVLHLKIHEIFPWYSFGTSEYFVQGALLIILCIVIKKFRWKYLLSFVTAFVYGLIIDGWFMILGREQYQLMPARIISAVAGIVLASFAVACFFRTSLPQEVWELFVKELAESYRLNMTKVKWIYDISSLSIGVVLMLIFFGRVDFAAIGIGTIISTIVNAPIIGMFGKIIDKCIEKVKNE